MLIDDLALLQEYAQTNSEQAFGALVSRHVNLVYSVALRQIRDPHLAEEITQTVFIILSRKAKSLSPKTILSGWLCRTARYISADTLKTQRRRQFREQESYMQSTLNQPRGSNLIASRLFTKEFEPRYLGCYDVFTGRDRVSACQLFPVDSLL